MAIKETLNKEGIPTFLFLNIHGGGWENDLMKIVVEYIYPESIERKLYKAGWHSSESEIFFKKNGIQYSIFLDEIDTIIFKPISNNFRIEIARKFANIIDIESEKIK